MMIWWMMILKVGYWPLASGYWSLAASLWVCQQQEASSQRQIDEKAITALEIQIISEQS
jgi:hypothetical protein